MLCAYDFLMSEIVSKKGLLSGCCLPIGGVHPLI